MLHFTNHRCDIGTFSFSMFSLRKSQYSHIALCCVNVVKQGLYCHPFYRYATLGSVEKARQNRRSLYKWQTYRFPTLHLAPLNVGILLVYVSGQTEI